MRVFVTGASGFVGGHVVQRLVAGHEVSAMARSEPAAAEVQRFGATAVRCAPAAERLVLAANTEGFTTLSLRPRLVWGPRDRSVLPAVLDTIRRGAFAWIDGGRHVTSTAHVDNVVDGIELALTRGRGGEAYFLADDERSTMREFLTRLVATAGVEVPTREISGGLVRATAAVVEGLWRVVRPGHRPSRGSPRR